MRCLPTTTRSPDGFRGQTNECDSTASTGALAWNTACGQRIRIWIRARCWLRQIVGGALGWAAYAGLYLFFAGTIDTIEVTFAAVCATIALGLAYATRATARRRFGGILPPRAILRPVASLWPDLLVVGRELVKVSIAGSQRQRGDFVRQPFDSGGDEALSRTRRAAAIIGVSLAPRTFVVRGEDSDELLLHCLPAKAPSADHRWPA